MTRLALYFFDTDIYWKTGEYVYVCFLKTNKNGFIKFKIPF